MFKGWKIGLALAVSGTMATGCQSPFAQQPMVHNSMAPASAHNYYQASPGPSIPTASTAHVPTSHAPANEILIQAWAPFQNPRLRTIHEISLNAASTEAIRDRLTQRGIPASGTHAEVRRRLLMGIASDYVQVHHTRELLDAVRWSLKDQKKTVAMSTIRAQELGRDIDTVKIDEQIAHLEGLQKEYEQRISSAGIQLGFLLGRQPTPALVKAIGDQPQLHLAEIDGGLPASVLRRRCDVRGAEQDVLAHANQLGVGESQMLPYLALRGQLSPRQIDSSSPGGQVDIAFGNAQDFTVFVQPQQQTANPLQTVAYRYQQVVRGAADEVETLLEAYRLAQVSAKELAEKSEAAKQKSLQLSEEFQFGGAEANDVVLEHIGFLQAAEKTAEARRVQAIAALRLFEAVGGQCHSDKFGSADFYTYGSSVIGD